ncbi:MAG TPA: ABC transporter ATP-binding protein [Bryobacteraceae bacterium]|nr:ABC transporter ATP-binding protein [Bryobacteraceae bacterium]
MNAVEVRNLSKNYPLSGSQFARFRRLLAHNPSPRDGIWALRDVSFSVAKGEAFGIIGANGSGKSTLLQVIAGILRPTSGSIEVNGRLSALLELGSGFSPEFTGRSNVYLNGSILGLSKEEIDERFETIERFAQIGDFIDQPIKTYSTGMVLRLAFAVVAHVDPEILIVDEALAVGDIAFHQRCMRRIHDLRARGTTILFVSHATTDVKALCERCLWLSNGVIERIGEADDVVGKYLVATARRELKKDGDAGVARVNGETATGADARPGFMDLQAGHRYGDGRATILSADLTDHHGISSRDLAADDRLTLTFVFRLNECLPSLVAGFLVRNNKGEFVFGTNTARENYPVPSMTAGAPQRIEFHWTMPPLTPGSYTISIGVADGDVEHFEMCDYVEDAIAVVMGEAADENGGQYRGYFRLRSARVSVYRV